MVIKEYYETRTDGVDLYISYSDEGFYIRKVGTNEVYEDAVDVENAPYTYEETDEKIEVNNEQSSNIESGIAETN
jgi:hypothetical protein